MFVKKLISLFKYLFPQTFHLIIILKLRIYNNKFQ